MLHPGSAPETFKLIASYLTVYQNHFKPAIIISRCIAIARYNM